MTKKVALVVGGSRGIGRQIAIDLARTGYACIVSGKSTSDAAKAKPFPPNPNSPQSTISTVVREIQEAGGEASAVSVDTRDFDSVQRMVARTIELMQRVNPEGLYGTVQACLPEFNKNGNKGRIIVVSPPIYSRFFKGKTAYAMGKVGMSVLTKGLAMDFVREGKTEMAITSIWPAAAIESGATQKEDSKELRKATIFSDAILAMLRSPAEDVNGYLELDEDYLRKSHGITDFSKYSVVPGTQPRRIMPGQFPDLTVAEQNDEGRRMNSTKERSSKI